MYVLHSNPPCLCVAYEPRKYQEGADAEHLPPTLFQHSDVINRQHRQHGVINRQHQAACDVINRQRQSACDVINRQRQSACELPTNML